MFKSQEEDRFIIRLPDGMRAMIKEIAKRNRRSMNSEIIFHLERVYGVGEGAAGEGFADTAPAANTHADVRASA